MKKILLSLLFMSVISINIFAGENGGGGLQLPMHKIVFSVVGVEEPHVELSINLMQYQTFANFIIAMKNTLNLNTGRAYLEGDVEIILGKNRVDIPLDANISDMYISSGDSFFIVSSAKKNKKNKKKKNKKNKMNQILLFGDGFPDGDGTRKLTSFFNIAAHETLADLVDYLKKTLTPNGYPFVEGAVDFVQMNCDVESLPLETRIADLHINDEDDFTITYRYVENQAVADSEEVYEL